MTVTSDLLSDQDLPNLSREHYESLISSSLTCALGLGGSFFSLLYKYAFNGNLYDFFMLRVCIFGVMTVVGIIFFNPDRISKSDDNELRDVLLEDDAVYHSFESENARVLVAEEEADTVSPYFSALSVLPL